MSEYERPIDVGEDIEEAKYKKICMQWQIMADEKFSPVQETTRQVPAGYYKLRNDYKIGTFLEKVKVVSDELYILPDTRFKLILDDIDKFWKLEDAYKEAGYAYKRGYLFHGSGGTGKSSIVSIICQQLINQRDGIVIIIHAFHELDHFMELIKLFKQIEPNRKIVLLIEDIDTFISNADNQQRLTSLLNVLDGTGNVSNMIILATTNYPEKLQERIFNRPSRFDRIYEVKIPTAEVRKFYITKKLKGKTLNGFTTDKLVELTKGFTLDHIKELILSVLIMGHPFEEVYNEIKEIKEKTILKSGSSKGVGFVKE